MSRPKATLLFTGGKDSVYTLLKLRQDFNPSKTTAAIIRTSLSHTNPHTVNIHVIKTISRLLGIDPVIVGPGNIGQALADASRGSEILAAGDIYLLDHAQWLARVAQEAGVGIVYEPLFNTDTRRLLMDVVESGIEFTVISVGSPRFKELLGFKVDRSSLDAFLEAVDRLGIDPMGEFAEYHTFVNRVPGYGWRIDYHIIEAFEEKGWVYTRLDYSVSQG